MTKAQWRERRVFNSYCLMQLTSGKAWIAYRSQMLGRCYQSAAWQVVATNGGQSDPQSHWQDYGHKTFNLWRPRDAKEKESTLKAAMKFARKVYGIKRWGRGPFGDWLPAGSMAEALEASERSSPTATEAKA